MLKIGISACYFHSDPKRPVFKGKTLLYLEESLAHWVMSENVLAYMIPSAAPTGPKLKDWVAGLDGLVLQGGSDVSPTTYGETALKPEWNGDAVRDAYEIELLKSFMNAGKPVLGICRGAQLMNVGLGGTLFQDIETQIEGSLNHRNWEIYDQNFHELKFEEGSLLSKLYPGTEKAKINTVHHQGLKALGKNLIIEAKSPKDGVIEAIRYTGNNFAFAVQWHPEFQDPKDKSLLDGKPILREFLKAAQNK
jgi:putative glutamine amidotransferase